MEDDLALAYVNVTDHNFTKKKKEGDLSISLAMITLSDSRPRWTGSTKHLETNSNKHEF